MRLLRRLSGALRPRRRQPTPAVILMYHRIVTEPSDPWRLCVTPANFAAQLDWLRDHYRVVPLRQLAAECGTGSLTRGSVAITFDDGYADNLLAGEPALRERRLPATFFLTTSTLGTQRGFWWDELECLLMRPGPLPATLRVSLDGWERSFDSGRAAAPCRPARECRDVRPWKAPPDSRLGYYYRVWDDLRSLDEPRRQEALAQLRVQLSEPPTSILERRILTHDEVRQLARSPIADIGAHSVTHASFLRCAPEHQRREMQQSKNELESLSGHPVHGFAYPHGDYSPESAQLARETGFEFACTVEETPISAATSVYLLPRLAVEDRGARAFAAQVRRAFG